MKVRAGEFDYQDARRYKHTRIGIWDLYEERQSDLPRIPASSISETYTQIIQNVPLLVRMLKDVLSIKRCPMLLSAYLVVQVLASLIPAVSLWYSGQLLRLVESPMETHTVDTTVLVHFVVAHLICTAVMRFLRYSRFCITHPLRLYINQFYKERIFHTTARFDVPAFQFYEASHAMWEFGTQFGISPISTAWLTIDDSTDIAMILIRLLSQLLVLITVVWEYQDGPLLVVLSFLQYILPWDSAGQAVVRSLVWAARTTNMDFIRMHGLWDLVMRSNHRQELVAGNLGEFISTQFREAAQRVGHDGVGFSELNQFRSFKDCLSIPFIFQETMHMLPQIVFTFRILKNPMITPISLASLILIKQTFHAFSDTASLSCRLTNLVMVLSRIRNLYVIEHIQNMVDGTDPFPENQQSLGSGISVEFRNVSFQYPGKDSCVLRNVSFKIGAGQLCVVVGVNGSGKSTILKLVCRIYDPTEGTILINDRDIKTFRLADLRAAMSILFQDHSQFPLSMRENIGLGNPALAHDDDKVREAARLGGAEEFIDELPDGFDTCLDRFVYNYHGDLPEGTTTLFGLPVNSSRRNLFDDDVHMFLAPRLQISRGQVQRLAISRTFMRSLVSETESSAGMLLFDEPSASLDPTAEYVLFERLRKLRGNKTMIFSTHRFGNLTQHADLILYIDETVQEAGTHDELMKKGGEYARIWNLQAKPFI